MLMKPVRFKKFVNSKELVALLNQVLEVGQGQVEVLDSKDKVIFGSAMSDSAVEALKAADNYTETPIINGGVQIGVARGDRCAEVVASMIIFAIDQYFLNREIANETLERYK